MEDITGMRPAEASNDCAVFVRRFVEEFEIRRRQWLRQMIASDEDAVTRRIAHGPSLSKVQRDALSSVPPNLAAALADRYLDSMLSKGDPRETDNWLRADVQAEVNALPDEVALQFSVLRAIRNFLTHDSAESRVRLESAVGQLALVDGRFELNQTITRRVLLDWLRSSHFRRLRLLCESIPATWRAMIVAETTQAGA